MSKTHGPLAVEPGEASQRRGQHHQGFDRESTHRVELQGFTNQAVKTEAEGQRQ